MYLPRLFLFFFLSTLPTLSLSWDEPVEFAGEINHCISAWILYMPVVLVSRDELALPRPCRTS